MNMNKLVNRPMISRTENKPKFSHLSYYLSFPPICTLSALFVVCGMLLGPFKVLIYTLVLKLLFGL